MSSSSRPWGLGLVVCGWLLGVGFSTIALSVLQAADGLNLETPSLVVVALLQAALWFGLLVVPLWLICSKRVVLSELGWGFKYRDFFSGLLIGVGTQMVLVPIIYLPLRLLDDNFDVSGPAREVVEKASGFGIVLLVLVVVVFGPIVEEIFFRGLALQALEVRMGSKSALVVSSIIFGLVHFQVLQFPALFLFGLIAGRLFQKDGRLGRAIWAHMGFNATTVAILLIAGPGA